MASPETLDFTRLLAPIAGENPAGRPLREDFSPRAIYRQIKDARTAARAAERQAVHGAQGVVESEASSARQEKPNWRPVLDGVPQVIAAESKDLELVAWLIEALVREHGFAGLRDGFRLVRELAEKFWDDLYPLPDEDGILTRVAPLAGLNGEDSDGVLINPILNVPITVAGSCRPLSLIDYRQATALEAIQDPAKRAQQIEQGVFSLEMFEKAVRETPADFFQNLLEDLVACSAESEKLGAVLDEKCGRGEDGYPLSPPSSTIRKALQDVRDQVERIAQQRPASSGAAEQDAPGKDGGASGATGSGDGPARGPIRTREEAFRTLLQTAEFFKRSEPHSPVSYVLEQAVRWGRMPLPELWHELIGEEAQRAEVFKLVGIRPPTEPEKHG